MIQKEREIKKSTPNKAMIQYINGVFFFFANSVNYYVRHLTCWKGIREFYLKFTLTIIYFFMITPDQ